MENYGLQVFWFVLPVLALASPILPDRQKEAELLALLKALDSVRDHAVRQSLGDV